MFMSDATMGLPVSPDSDENPVSAFASEEVSKSHVIRNQVENSQELDSNQQIHRPDHLSMPTASDAPVRPLRRNRMERQAQKLRSVPSMKGNLKTDVKTPGDQKPKTSRTESSFTSNLIRRLSKYQIRHGEVDQLRYMLSQIRDVSNGAYTKTEMRPSDKCCFVFILLLHVYKNNHVKTFDSKGYNEKY
jgi:hypothetical protein